MGVDWRIIFGLVSGLIFVVGVAILLIKTIRGSGTPEEIVKIVILASVVVGIPILIIIWFYLMKSQGDG